jgi:hypothetical protein
VGAKFPTKFYAIIRYSLADKVQGMLEKYKLIETITTEEGTVNVYENGLLESIINEGAFIDVQYIRDGKTKLEKHGSGRKFYVISNGAGFYRISKQARVLAASKDYAEHIAAVAVITNHVSIRYVLDLYLKLDKPASPTKAFTDKQKALDWLLGKMEEDRKR